MRKHRFISDFNFSVSPLIVTDQAMIDQWRKVLRLEVGAELILGDGRGQVAEGRLLSFGRDRAEIEIISVELVGDSPRRPVALYLAILKRDNFELAVQKAVECGVTRIVPINTERTVKLGLNTDRLAKIIREAAEQSGRAFLPELGPGQDFSIALKKAREAGDVIIFDLAGETLPTLLPVSPQSIFIGPEGGFTEAEVAQARAAGACVASLGPLTLRAETAAIISSYLTVNL